MSVHVVSSALPDWGQIRAVIRLCRRLLREPSAVTETDVVTEGEGLGAHVVSATVSLVFDPDLTPDQVATFDQLLPLASADSAWTPEAYAAVRTQMQTLRDLRQLGRSAFMALSAAERDRMLYDAFTATTIVLLSMLRDE